MQSAVGTIGPDTINLWPYYAVPRLEDWVSDQSKVVILEDAAHAVPPIAGQGVNQTFEDVYMLALLLRKLSLASSALIYEATLKSNLVMWQRFGQERADRILD